MKTFDQLKTFEDACQALELDAKTVVPDFPSFPFQTAIVAHAKLMVIAHAANKLANGGVEWQPDWNNYDQYKYIPWFEMGGSSGFRFYDCDAWLSGSYVGSRLCFISDEVATYIGRQFVDLYKQAFMS